MVCTLFISVKIQFRPFIFQCLNLFTLLFNPILHNPLIVLRNAVRGYPHTQVEHVGGQFIGQVGRSAVSMCIALLVVINHILTTHEHFTVRVGAHAHVAVLQARLHVLIAVQHLVRECTGTHTPARPLLLAVQVVAHAHAVFGSVPVHARVVLGDVHVGDVWLVLHLHLHALLIVAFVHLNVLVHVLAHAVLLGAVVHIDPTAHAHHEVAAGHAGHGGVGLEHELGVEVLRDGVLPEVRVGHLRVRVVRGQVGVRRLVFMVGGGFGFLAVVLVLTLTLRSALLLAAVVSIRVGECILLRVSIVGLLFASIGILLVVALSLFGLSLSLV